MTSEERAEIIITARLLQSASPLQWLATELLVVTAAVLLLNLGNLWVTVIALGVGALAIGYAFRVALDARLFNDIANETLSTEELDQALTRLGKINLKTRPWSDRCRGARRLIARAACATAVQLIAIVAAALS
jgi:hypothetical protein